MRWILATLSAAISYWVLVITLFALTYFIQQKYNLKLAHLISASILGLANCVAGICFITVAPSSRWNISGFLAILISFLWGLYQGFEDEDISTSVGRYKLIEEPLTAIFGSGLAFIITRWSFQRTRRENRGQSSIA